MLKTLSAYIGEYKKVSIKTPIYIIVEVLMEILIPFVTASIIDKGIQAGDMSKVLMYGGLMLVLAFISLFAGIQAGKYSALASTGILPQSMFSIEVLPEPLLPTTDTNSPSFTVRLKSLNRHSSLTEPGL